MKKLLFSLLFFVALSTQAATIYVSTSGNDATGNGSAASPYKTMFKATSVSKSGDIIHFNIGTFTETQSSNLPTGVSIEGEGVTSVIKASFSTVYQAILYCSSNEGTNGNQSISNIKFDGQNNTSWAIQIQGRSNVEIHDCTIINFKQRGIVWGGRADNSDNPPSTYATGNKCYNNIITNCGGFDGTYGYGCLNIGGQDGMLIYGNNITTTGTNPGWPIKLWNDGYIKGCKIYNNILKRPPYPYQYNGINNYFDFCIEMFHEQGLEIYNNTIEGSIDLNYQSKGNYDYSVYIHDNIIGRDIVAAHCETGVWLEEYSEYVTIEKNIFKNCSQPIMFSLRPANYMNNININGNLAYGIGKTDGSRQGTAIGIIVNDDTQNYTANNFNVTGNNFIALTGNNAPFFGVVIPGGNSSKTLKFVNNVVTGFNYQSLVCYAGSHVNGFIYTDNIIYNTNTTSLGSPTNFTNTNNRNIDPQLDANYISALGVGYGTNVPPPATLPTADAGADITITLPVSQVTLTGTGTGTGISYKWQRSDGGIIANAASVIVSSLTEGVYDYKLTVTDNIGATATDTARVTVLKAAPPAKTLLLTIHVYTDKTVSTAKALNKRKTLLTDIKVYSDGSIEK